MRILVACEWSGRVRDLFREAGHDAWSCDMFAGIGKHHKCHYQGDVFGILYSQHWDRLIAFPPCTYLCVSGMHWNGRTKGRAEKTEAAVEFVRKLLDAPIEQIALENPIGIISTRIRQPDQIIQPYEFGEDASKLTCLWLKNLPLLPIVPEARLPGRMVEWPRGSGKIVERWGNQTDSGQNKLSPGRGRGSKRAVTYMGIARAMLATWQ